MPAPPPHDPLRPDAALTKRLERLGLEFAIEFHEAARRHHPDDLEVLAELGHAYTRLGRNDQGLEVDQRLVELVPRNPTAHYNLACSLALTGRGDEALTELELSVRLGYEDLEHLLEDEDLVSLRDQPRFHSLVAALQGLRRS